MDLSIKVQDTTLNIRVAGLVKTTNGFLFEKSKNGYIFTIGGRVRVGESTHEALIREVMEEIGMKAEKVTLRSVIENFYTSSNEKVQEICFVYEVDNEFTGAIPPEFIQVTVEDIDKYDVRPKPIIDLLKSEKGSFKHIIIK